MYGTQHLKLYQLQEHARFIVFRVAKKQRTWVFSVEKNEPIYNWPGMPELQILDKNCYNLFFWYIYIYFSLETIYGEKKCIFCYSTTKKKFVHYFWLFFKLILSFFPTEHLMNIYMFSKLVEFEIFYTIYFLVRSVFK